MQVSPHFARNASIVWLLLCSQCAAQIETKPASVTDSSAAESLDILSPVPYQVCQRKGFVPKFAHSHHPGGAALGYADVEVIFRIPEESAAKAGSFDSFEYQIRTSSDIPEHQTAWTKASFTISDGKLTSIVRINGGGWYQLNIRCRKDGLVVSHGAVTPVGVGEVFLIAGQSYATNTNEVQMKVVDVGQRVAAYNFRTAAWQVANDPQPTADQSDGGSIWPALGDLLVSSLNVPVGFANVAYGGTSSAQWQPGGGLFGPLADVGKNLKSVRAVLWQQGESDVIGKVSAEDYVKNLVAIRDEAAKVWGYTSPWLLAKSTLHPTVYDDPAGEGRIRNAVERLLSQPGFLRGPDTDVLDGANRGGPDSRRHFSGEGQRNAAALWFAAIMPLINQPRPDHEVVLRELPKLHLLQPAGSSPIVHRESSVLIRSSLDAPATARLAFETSEIIQVNVASTGQRLEDGKDWTLASDRRTLLFAADLPFEAITQEQMFPPKDSPNSYRHRRDNPDQNLLYQPGRWFHDHNIEVTYRRVSKAQFEKSSAPNQFQPELLKRTIAKLESHQPIHIAVSGDSISTGLDSSSVAFAPPFQLGYSELVAAQLQDWFQSPVTLTNRAVSGWSIADGNRDAEAIIAAKPDLIVIAYGMNDVGRRDPSWFSQQTGSLITNFQTRLPQADLILVAPMLGHAQWIHTPREMFALYRDELQKLTGPGIVLADLTEVWTRLLAHKHDLDLTGNGLNHPNDFGHRLYAQAILSLMIGGKP